MNNIKVKIKAIVIAIMMMATIIPANAFADETANNTLVHFEASQNYDYAFKTLELVNQKRAAQGRAMLKMDREMTELAMQRAGEIALMFSHTRPNGYTAYDVNGRANGENVGFGYSTPAAMVDGWMGSAGHRANILDANYKCIGIGCAKVGDYYYWVQCFSWDDAVETARSAYSNRTVKVAVETDYIVLRQNGVEIYTDLGPMDVGETGSVCLRTMDNGTGLCHYIDASDFNITSSNSGVASISGDRIKAVSAGSYTVTVAHKNNSGFAFSEKYNVYGAPSAAKVEVKGTNIKKVTRYKKAIKVTWKKKTGITGYQIRYSTSKSMTGAKTVEVAKAKTTSKKIKKLEKKTRYYVQVRTYKSKSGKLYYSGWSGKKTAKTR